MAYYDVNHTLQQLMGQQGSDEAQVPQQGPLPTDPFGLTSWYEGAPPGIPVSTMQQNLAVDPAMIQQMIDGMGVDPATMAQMRAQNVQDQSNAALPQLGAVRRGLSSAGQLNSPAGAAMQAIIGRHTGDAITAGNREIDINNAGLINQNRTSALALAHQTALANSAQMFSGLSQNLGNAGANFRTGLSTAFNQNPFNPGSGRPQESGVAPALTGAANQIGQIKPQQQPAPQNPLGNAPIYEQQGPPQAADKPFQKNPYQGY